MKKRVAVLGATCSIGKSALDVLRGGRDLFEPVLLTANRRCGELSALKKEFPGVLTALAHNASGPGADYSGEDGLLRAIADAAPDITINGISGAAGLLPSEAAINAGSDLALANKETVVMAGSLIFELAAKKRVRILPVDSEHMAIKKLLEAHGLGNAEEIILTASGGPFREKRAEELESVKPEEALAHPTWNMGPKITIDSATLANKGLEVIEAAAYFGFPAEKIKVVIHPQSVVHSMVRLRDGAVYAQMSKPDMRLVIHEALCWPDTEHSPFGVLDFDSLCLDFEKCDFSRFPMLALAFKALEGGQFHCVAYNAANEAAVAAFLEGRAGFLEIPRIVEYVFGRGFAGKIPDRPPGTIGEILAQDKLAREMAEEYISGKSNNGSLQC